MSELSRYHKLICDSHQFYSLFYFVTAHCNYPVRLSIWMSLHSVHTNEWVRVKFLSEHFSKRKQTHIFEGNQCWMLNIRCTMYLSVWMTTFNRNNNNKSFNIVNEWDFGIVELVIYLAALITQNFFTTLFLSFYDVCACVCSVWKHITGAGMEGKRGAK